MTEIIEVKSDRELRQFMRLPDKIYKNDKCYVPELYLSRKKIFNRTKNPFFEHSRADFFLALKDKRPTGRIAVIRNNIHLHIAREKCGFFGFFEVIDDYEVAKALLDRAVDWIRNEGLKVLTGPENFTTNESCGLLISGFELPPVINMPYNKEYYNDFLRRYGFAKATDLSSWYIDDQVLTSPAIINIVTRTIDILGKSGISFRRIDFGKLEKEFDDLREIYNDANSDNWGFLPLTEKEFQDTATQFRQFVPADLVIMAEKDHRLIGFVVAIPDLNQAFIHIKSGKLFPLGFLKLLWYRTKITNSRILILGVSKEYRNRGIDIVLYKKIQENLAKHGIYHGEACYVMENNVRMNSIMKKIGGVEVKKYRIYQYEAAE